ncbi:hypothetical protein [Dyadobacter sp. CY343]|uniref:hypothetical protein n=1 Tax=Dyadobacter sp. CY343 TaxID=2907299 RepID=UPI001F430BEC|nr:hypothetical protein [Dyadobacter sp. CY343]MCE7062893.1 hypothetical protein [Dyadobacter sp. CY343]
MGKIQPPKKNLATPGVPLSEEEFLRSVKEAEKGPFYAVNETAQFIANWKSKYEKSHSAK